MCVDGRRRRNLYPGIRRLFGRELPMLGINMGTLGYLTEVEVQNVEEAVKQLVEGNYTIEERMMLYGYAHTAM